MKNQGNMFSDYGIPTQEEVNYVAMQWALEQIKNISDPMQAAKKFKELKQSFIDKSK